MGKMGVRIGRVRGGSRSRSGRRSAVMGRNDGEDGETGGEKGRADGVRSAAGGTDLRAPLASTLQSSLAEPKATNRETRKIARTLASGTAECFASTGITPRPLVRTGREILPRSCARTAERSPPVANALARATPPSRLTPKRRLPATGAPDGVPVPRAQESAAACEDAISSLSVSHEPYGSAVALGDARVSVEDARSV